MKTTVSKAQVRDTIDNKKGLKIIFNLCLQVVTSWQHNRMVPDQIKVTINATTILRYDLINWLNTKIPTD